MDSEKITQITESGYRHKDGHRREELEGDDFLLRTGFYFNRIKCLVDLIGI
jgi:hypothetical protein